MTAPARAADPAYITLGAGIWDIRRDDERTAEFRVEYRSNWELLWIIKPFAGAMMTPNGSFHAFGGFLALLGRVATDVRRLVAREKIAYRRERRGR